MRERTRVPGPREVPPPAVAAERLPELSNLGFEKRLDAPPRRREIIRYSSHARFLARWSAP
ncbi:MAG: hypothetical protein ABI682_14060 [Acidobacteriota bacterium]